MAEPDALPISAAASANAGKVEGEEGRKPEKPEKPEKPAPIAGRASGHAFDSKPAQRRRVP